MVEISAEDLMGTAKDYDVDVERYEGMFVAYLNRDSVPFREWYGIPEAKTVLRGSLRYKGNPEFVGALGRLGWLGEGKREWLRDGMTWAEIQRVAIDAADTDEE